MRGKKVNELLKKTSVKAGGVLLATAIVFGAAMYGLDSGSKVPELVTYVDVDGLVDIMEDETPLAAPKVTTSTKVTKKTKKIKLKKAAKKTYSKKGKSTTKKQTSKSKVGNTTTTTETVVATSILNKYKKGSKTQTRVTTTKTTVTKTVLTAASAYGSAATASTAASTTQTQAGSVTVASAAPKVDSRVSGAFNTLGFKVTVNPSVSYSGLFDARTRTITLKRVDSTIYHELGHFLAFVAGNVDTSAAFVEVFNQEKSKYTAYNKSYVLANSAEYFAESFRNYTENPSALQAERPQTYAAIQAALSNVTTSQISRIASVYSAVWK